MCWRGRPYRTITETSKCRTSSPVSTGLRAELTGFKTHVADNIALEGTQIRRMDIRLDVGQVAEQITVEAGRAVITTDTAEISTGFTQKLFDASPMVRTYYPQALMATLPTTDSTHGNLRAADRGTALDSGCRGNGRRLDQ